MTTRFVFVLSLLIFPIVLHGQITLSGQITEATTGQPIPFASIAIKGRAIGTQADEAGRYQLVLRQSADSLLVSALGFHPATRAIVADKSNQLISIQLLASTATLGEVVIRAGENPAYRILREVIAQRKQNDFRNRMAYEYEAYSQLSIGLSQLSEKFRRRKAVQAVLKPFENDQTDTLKPGSKKRRTDDPSFVLPVFLSETVSQLYGRKKPDRTKEEILKTNISSVGLTDDSFVALFTGAGFNTLNFYRNTVGLFKKEFISPLAESGRTAYRYFLVDTTRVGLHTCYGIDFDPKNPRDLVMQGRVWIDTLTYALVQIDAHVGRETNLNFIQEIRLEQSYDLLGDSVSAWLPERTHLTVHVGELVKNTFGATVDYLTTIRSAQIDQPKPTAFFDTEVEIASNRNKASEGYWQTLRREAQSKTNDRIRAQLDTIRNLPLIKTATQLGAFILNGGHFRVGKSFLLGSSFSAWAFNQIEGHRFQLGVKTSPEFSQTWQLSAHGAYGTRDQVWKSGWEIRFIPTRKPLTLLTLKSSYDLEQLGLRSEDLADNPFLGIANRFGRRPKAYYQSETSLTVQRDLNRDIIQTVGFRARTFNPAFPFAFQLPPEGGSQPRLIPNYRAEELFIETRYVPGRLPSRKINSRRIRQRSGETAPIVTLRYTHGWYHTKSQKTKGYNKWQAELTHSLRWGLWGRTVYTVQAGFIPSAVPYPLLQVHLGNPTPIYNRNAFNLMNGAEFVSSRYASLALEHTFEGLLTNRLPLIRRWGWRTFVEGKILWGNLSTSNRRMIASRDHRGHELPSINSFYKQPYIEVGYGVENIFRLVRVEALHRLTYRNYPAATNFAIKLSFRVGL